jgi:probable rRNA maturation factor
LRAERRGRHYLPPWRIDVAVRSGVDGGVPSIVLARAMADALSAADAPQPAAVSLTLSHDAELAALNEDHMGHAGPTDVLSFPLLPPSAFPAHSGQDPSTRAAGQGAFVLPPGRRVELGDVVVSVERAAEQAAEGRGGQTGDVGWSLAEELRLLVVHGTLHLCGWDHVEPDEEAAMRALEQRILEGP